MKPLDSSSKRSTIVHSHLVEDRNVLPKSREKFLCLIPNNRPFLYNEVGTKASLHTLLTSPCFDFANLYELTEEEQGLFGKIEAFCTILYTAHKILNNEYVGARIAKIEEKSTYPQFHKHFSFVESAEPERISISTSTNFSSRYHIYTDEQNGVVLTLQKTRDLLLDTAKPNILDETGYNLSARAQELEISIQRQLEDLFKD